MLITAQSHWWKDIPKLWRRCAVFSLSFDYIPNYSASKQLNEAWMLRTNSVCNWTALLHFGHLIALIFLPVCECMRMCDTERSRERCLMKEECSWSSEVLITRVNSIRMASSRIAGGFHDVTICCMWAGKGVYVQGWGKGFFVRTVLFTVRP